MAIKKLGLVAVMSAGLLLLAGCAGGVNNGVDQSKVDKAAQALLPADFLENGIDVASDIPYEPFEYNDENGDLTGFDVELGALISQKLGTELRFNDAVFDTIIASLEAGTNDIIISSMSDTLERQAKVDFVDYHIGGSQMIVAKGNPEGIVNAASLCGKTVIVQNGTIQIDLVGTMSADCEAAGNPSINLTTLPDAPLMENALRAGQGDAVMMDSLVAQGAAAKAGDGEYFDVVTDPAAPNGYDAGFVGVAILKKDTALRDAIQAALQSLIDDGQYATLLAKWNMSSNGVSSASVNGTVE
ncbi:MAG: ABC transporter substrate-binding protein [Rhodoluna sp.]|nr:ABC transporter substrate-binding protein [Rhodoluna sp.]